MTTTWRGDDYYDDYYDDNYSTGVHEEDGCKDCSKTFPEARGTIVSALNGVYVSYIGSECG